VLEEVVVRRKDLKKDYVVQKRTDGERKQSEYPARHLAHCVQQIESDSIPIHRNPLRDLGLHVHRINRHKHKQNKRRFLQAH